MFQSIDIDNLDAELIDGIWDDLAMFGETDDAFDSMSTYDSREDLSFFAESWTSPSDKTLPQEIIELNEKCCVYLSKHATSKPKPVKASRSVMRRWRRQEASKPKIQHVFNEILCRKSIEKFPGIYIMHMNSGNFDGLKALFGALVRKDCVVCSSSQKLTINLPVYFEMCEILLETIPDMVMMLSASQVANNQITAKIVFKVTDNIVLSEAYNRRMQILENQEENYQSKSRVQKFLESHHEFDDEKFANEVKPLLESDEDLTIHGSINFSIEFDEVTKLIQKITFAASICDVKRREYITVPDAQASLPLRV